MAALKNLFQCSLCGNFTPKWSGQCTACGAWDVLVEASQENENLSKSSLRRTKQLTFTDLSAKNEEPPRFSSGIEELDRVLGGGCVEGSAILIGGEPGVGKSTLLLQLAAAQSTKYTQAGSYAAYISGEESENQITMRAKRLGLENAPVMIATSTSVADILKTLDVPSPPKLVIIDSIQTLYVEEIGTAPGTVMQVRTAAHKLIRLAKKRNIIMVLVGHVTKEGQIAGPKVLEHMVDTVLYCEGERGYDFRMVRAVKNRFGPANEVGVFQMTGKGMMEVKNPSALFLSDRIINASGTVVFAGIEGSRPILVEIQALVSPSSMATPRRAVVGWDSNRLAMVIAVLHARYKLNLMDKEIYLNVAGGFKINEPAADLAVAAALISAAINYPIPHGTVFFGELGLSGEVRKVASSDARLKEAEKLGFSNVMLPTGTPLHGSSGMEQHFISHITGFKDIILNIKD